MKKKRWDQIAFPKLLVSKTAKKTKPKSFKVSKGQGSNTAQSLKANAKSIPVVKNRPLTRAAYLGGKTEQGKNAWNVYKDTLIEDRATTMVPHTEWVDVKAGSEVTEGGKEVKSKGFSGGQKRVTTMKDSGLSGWTDAYTGERIHKRGGPEGTSMDHTVSIDRAIRSGKFNTPKKAQGFGTFLKNLVITKGATNTKKGAKDLGEFTPTHEPKKYAKRYGSVMSDLGMVMTHGEGRAYKRMTGEEPPTQVQHILDMMRGEEIAHSQERRDMWMMKGRKKK